MKKIGQETHDIFNKRFRVKTVGGEVIANGRIATGSERTVLQRDLARKLGFRPKGVKATETMITPDGERLNCFKLPVILTVDGRSAVIAAAVPKDFDPPRNLIGNDFLRATAAQVNCGTGKIWFPPHREEATEFSVGGGLWTFGKVRRGTKKIG